MESAKEKRILFVLAEMLIFDNCLYFNVNFALFFAIAIIRPVFTTHFK